jgi:hypothetical protein
VSVRRQAEVDQVDGRIGDQLVKLLVGGHPRNVNVRALRAEVALDIGPVALQPPLDLVADRRHAGAAAFLVREIMDPAHEADPSDSHLDHDVLLLEQLASPCSGSWLS